MSTASNQQDLVLEQTGDATGIDLSGYTFPAIDISFLNFAGADLSGAQFGSVTAALGVNFNGANLEGALFS